MAEKLKLDKRRIFTARQKAQIFKRANGNCELCGKSVTGKWIAGHIKPHSLGGLTKIDNGRVEGVDCGCAKVTAANDTKVAAKAERQAGRKGQYARRIKRGGSMIKGPSKEQRKTAYERMKKLQKQHQQRKKKDG